MARRRAVTMPCMNKTRKAAMAAGWREDVAELCRRFDGYPQAWQRQLDQYLDAA